MKLRKSNTEYVNQLDVAGVVKNEDNEEIHLPLPPSACVLLSHPRPSFRAPSVRAAANAARRRCGAVSPLWAEVATSGAASQSHTLKAVKIRRNVRPRSAPDIFRLSDNGARTAVTFIAG